MRNGSSNGALLSVAEVEAIFAPLESARTLPPRAFVDPRFFEEERQAIFFGGWAALCLADFVPDVGDASPLNFLGAPLLVVRASESELRVFHNLCPYDQCPVLLEAVQKASKLSSAYHGWEFDLAGKLTSAPYWMGAVSDGADMVSHSSRDLQPVASGLFGKVLFVNVDGRAVQSFEEFIAPLRRRFGKLDFRNLDVGRDTNGARGISRFKWRGNWKTHHENACINVYHESTVHMRYSVSDEVPRVTPDRQKRYEEVVDGGLRGLAFSRQSVGDTYDSLGLPDLKTKQGEAVQDNTIVSLYPNLYCSLIGQHLHLTIVTPNGPDEVEVMTASYFDAAIAVAPEFSAVRGMVEAGWTRAGLEDAAIIEAIHSARSSPVAAAGYYSPFWDRPHHSFSQQVARDLGLGPREDV